MMERRLTITNKRGLHARASARFVQCARRFNAEISVERDGHIIPATSIMGLMMLAASTGHSIILRAHGPEAESALDALQQLVEGQFDED